MGKSCIGTRRLYQSAKAFAGYQDGQGTTLDRNASHRQSHSRDASNLAMRANKFDATVTR
jgi:hypothetical protein